MDSLLSSHLDAGHGGHDFGAVYNGHVEKNIALAVVLKVGKLLEANSKVDVIYTKKTDILLIWLKEY
jgi:N-acetylmuramoyl-L-alanine amidase